MCLKEEARGLKNLNATSLGNEVDHTFKEIGDGKGGDG